MSEERKRADTGSKRFNTNKAIFVSRLLRVWEKAPELSFSELLVHCSTFERQGPAQSDNDIIEALERWVLLHDTERPPGG